MMGDFEVTALILLAALVGAVLRRIFGGFLGLRRAICTVMLVGWTVAAVWWRWHDLAPWFDVAGYTVPQIARAGLLTAMAWVGWVWGHRFANERGNALPWALALRYGIPSVGLVLLTGFLPAMAVGPLVGLSYKAAQWWGKTTPTPFDRPGQQAIDGPWGWGELALGAVYDAAWWAAALLSA